MEQGARTVTLSVVIKAVSRGAIKIDNSAFPRDDSWIPKSLILDCDQDLDEIENGDEIAIEIPAWKAKELRLI